jgi:predicted 3-demethylubiquinone-9 3-methyltransferase (glyoxalase superfamily)
MPKITPFLWFDTQAEDAANFYVSVFPNSKILKTSLVPEGAPGKVGGVQTVSFVIDGQEVTALNGGTWQTLDEAFSFTVHCKDQAEVDHYWDALSEGGKTSVCGWTKDKFGLSWQITPSRLMELIADPDKAKVGRVMAAMMQMTKIDIAKLEEAAAAA